MPLFGSESTTNQIDNTRTVDKKIGAENSSVFQNDGGGDFIYTEVSQEALELAEKSVMALTEFTAGALKSSQDNAAKVIEAQASGNRSEQSDLAGKLVTIGVPAAILIFVLGRALK